MTRSIAFAPLTSLNTATAVRRRSRVTGRDEVTTAYSTDRQWAFHRIEDTGTTWDVEHLPSKRIAVMVASTLDSARRATASGEVLRLLDEQDARAAQRAADSR